MGSPHYEPGFRLGKYEILAHLSSGGMGAIYQAIDRGLGRTVALKVLSPDRLDDDRVKERFRREARNAARLNHPNIVTLYECGFDAGQNLLYLAMEFVDGTDLARHITRHGSLRPEETRRILIQAAKALVHAFNHGIVHRDIKPANFMLAREGRRTRVKLTDLGVAIAKGAGEFRITSEGCTVGTVDYMAPEQARDSQAADTRSDIYSLGCTAYHMLAGKPPFAQGGLGERVCRHQAMAPPDLRPISRTMSSGFWAIIQRMLAKKPEDRYADPEMLLQALKQTAAEKDSAPSSSSRYARPHAGRTAKRQSRSSTIMRAAPVIALEQSQAAAELHERALQMLDQEQGEKSARELLEKALQLDPLNVNCRQSLRDLNRRRPGGFWDRWFHSGDVSNIKSAMRFARSRGEWRTVLEQGERVLACQAADADTHLELAETAADVGLLDLARWFLEQGRLELPDNGELLRALARLYEHMRLWRPAVAYWRNVLELDPSNSEARRKVTEISARDQRARYQHRHA